jgi:hypothetical protein
VCGVKLLGPTVAVGVGSAWVASDCNLSGVDVVALLDCTHVRQTDPERAARLREEVFQVRLKQQQKVKDMVQQTLEAEKARKKAERETRQRALEVRRVRGSNSERVNGGGGSEEYMYCIPVTFDLMFVGYSTTPT